MWWSDSEQSAQRSDTLENVQQNFNSYMDARESEGYQVYPGTESEQYDFTAERQSMRGTNIVEATTHLIKSCIGAGLLSIHYGFMCGGLWTSLVATAGIGVVVFYTMMLLIRSAHKMYVRLRVPKLSYSDLVEMAVATGPWKCLRPYSKPIRYLVDFCLIAEMCGACCIYEIMIATTMKLFLESTFTVIKEADLSIRYYVLIASGPLIILSVIRNLKYLAPVSFLADAVIVTCILTTMYYSFINADSIHERQSYKHFKGLTMFFGVCLYSMGGFTIMLPIENNMRKPKYYFIVLQYGIPIAVCIIICAGFLGYWGWGEKCQSPVTLHMPADIIPLILQCLMMMMLSILFAVHFWVPFRMLWFYIGRLHYRYRGVWERFYRLIHVLLITAIAVAVPHVRDLIIFIGNFFITATALIFPAFTESLVTWREHPSGKIRWSLLRNIIIIGLGLFFWCSAFYSTIKL